MQSHCDKDRPTSSGRSQAIFTTWIATSGGKDRLAAASGTIAQPLQAIVQEPLDPLPNVLLRQVDQPGDFDERQTVCYTEDRPTPPG
jgi:hypothetical protein